MSEYTFETAALKAVTIDAVKYNEEGLKNSLTPEAIQQVVPMAWGKDRNNKVPDGFGASVAIGGAANEMGSGVAIGYQANTGTLYATAIGMMASAKGGRSIAITGGSTTTYNDCGIVIGSDFIEYTSSGSIVHYSSNRGFGSITIGAGANTLNNGTTESSNSVTIGCKASNSGADSVVIGASANTQSTASVVVGANAKAYSSGDVAIGNNAEAVNLNSTAVGANSRATSILATALGASAYSADAGMACGAKANAANIGSTAIGVSANAKKQYTTAIGADSTVSDYGATVIRSTASDGTYTQLYFSGANTPLAKKYFPTAWEQKQDVDEQGNPLVDENGEPVMVDDPEKPIAGEAMMGFVAKDSAGNIIARGANMLSALFPYYTGEDDNPFQPTGTSLRGGEKPEPVAFHPSDLDMTTEEPVNEPEEYQPLPVYPIVEPAIQEPEMSEYEPLPVYPIVEPETFEISE